MKNGFTKLLLIDETASFENVKRETLSQILIDMLSDISVIIIAFLIIDAQIIMDIISDRVNPFQAIFKGDPNSSVIQCL